MARRADPWASRGWRTQGDSATVAGILCALFLAIAVVAGWGLAEELQYEVYERERYILAEGRTEVAPDGTPEVVLSAPEIGELRLPWPWLQPEPDETVRVKVGRRDPSDYLFEYEFADPAGAALPVAVTLGMAALATGAAAVAVRRGSHDTTPVLDAAAPALDPDLPPEVELPGSVARVAPRVSPAYLLGAFAVALAVVAFPTGISKPEYRRVEGTIVASPGGYAVSFSDPRRGGDTWARPMTSVEARGRAVGERYAWDVAIDPHGGFISPNDPNWWLGAGWLAVLGARRWRWHRALRKATASDARPVALAGWVRVRWGTTWLALTPYGSTRVRDVRLVPVHRDAPVPDAVRSVLWVRGPLRRGAAAVVHSREGVAWWPVGRVRGPVAAALLGPSPWAPKPGQGRLMRLLLRALPPRRAPRHVEGAGRHRGA